MDDVSDVGDVLARHRGAAVVKVIVMTGVDTTNAALNALRGQPYDLLPREIEPPRLS